jgi:hypothetical protein
MSWVPNPAGVGDYSTLRNLNFAAGCELLCRVRLGFVMEEKHDVAKKTETLCPPKATPRI